MGAFLAPATASSLRRQDAAAIDDVFEHQGGRWRLVHHHASHVLAPPADPFPNYAAGSAGPAAADKLLERDNRKWRAIR